MRRKFANRIPDADLARITEFQLNPSASVKALARKLGVEVVEETLDSEVRGYLDKDIYRGGRSGYVIVLNKRDRTEVKRFTVLHELAHFYLHTPKTSEVFEERQFWEPSGFYINDNEEQEANAFAEDVLMPLRLLDHLHRHNNPTVSDLAKYFWLSEGVVRSRVKFYYHLKRL